VPRPLSGAGDVIPSSSNQTHLRRPVPAGTAVALAKRTTFRQPRTLRKVPPGGARAGHVFT